MFNDETRSAVAAIAARHGWEPAALLAVAEVESAGKAFAMVDGRREPLIRFEGHYFDGRLSGAKRERARAEGLANPAAGAVKNPAGQAARWSMLARAEAIDAGAARESVSWGVGQVMGGHWSWLGYASVDELVAEARSGVAGQVELMARFIEKAGLSGALRKHDWPAFARGYNGPAYKKNAYDTKIAKAYARWTAKGVPAATAGGEVTPNDAILRRGSKGPFVVELQRNLASLGYAVGEPDGDFGERTENAVKAFQKTRGLTVDGWAGPRTIDAIGKAIAEKAAKPKIEKAEKIVPPAAAEEVEEKTTWWQKVTGFFGASGVGGSLLWGVDWRVIAVIAGVTVLLLILLLIFRRQIIGAFREINAEVR